MGGGTSGRKREVRGGSIFPRRTIARRVMLPCKLSERELLLHQTHPMEDIASPQFRVDINQWGGVRTPLFFFT